MANLHGEDLLQKGLPRTSLTPCSLAGRYVTCWWPPPAGTATSPWPASSSLCWARRTGCWTWASCPTSAAASPTPRCPGRRSVRLSVFSATFPSRSSSLPGNSYTIISSLSSALCPLLSAPFPVLPLRNYWMRGLTWQASEGHFCEVFGQMCIKCEVQKC